MPSKKGSDTGYRDINGREICIGDVVLSGSHEGRVEFGIYNDQHYGVYIRWDDSDLRKDFLFWVNERGIQVL